MQYTTKITLEKTGADVLQEWLLGTTAELDSCFADPRILSVAFFRNPTDKPYGEILTTFESEDSYNAWIAAYPSYLVIKSSMLSYAEKMGITVNIYLPPVPQHADDYWLTRPDVTKFNDNNLAHFITIPEILAGS